MSDGEEKVRHPVDEMVDDLRARQRNTVFPDGRAGGGRLDALLWKGSDTLSGIQRVGIAFIGLFMVMIAVAFAAEAATDHSILWTSFAIGLLYVGARVLFNSIPKRKPTK
jgi:hypothetical protein